MSQRFSTLALVLRDAVLSAALLISAELLVVGASRWETIASLWELQFGTLWLLPVAMLTAVAVAGSWGVVLLAVQRRSSAARVVVVAMLAGFGLALGYGLSGGRHFELWWRRLGFVLVCGGAWGWFAWMVHPWLRNVIEGGRWTRAALLLGVATVLELVNQFLLVRLYPAFHLGLAVLAVGAVTTAVRIHGSNWATTGSSPSAVAAPVVLVAAAALVPYASQRLARFDNFRLLLLESAPTLAHAVRLASLIAPPPPLVAAPRELDSAEVQGGVDISGRDVLLITIDALRADHVGAYGYERPTTPNIDRLASDGARFDAAYCATPHTSYSVTSLMSGKYIRPLLLQGAGQGSDTWASLLRTYGYRTAAFYPPAVFFIDRDRFEEFERTNLGFEYQKKEFLEGDARVAQVVDYLDNSPEQPIFMWVHLFGPHEPYEEHAGFDFGERDIDRYDSEVAAADATVGKLVGAFRAKRPQAVVVVSSDHGEEFGEHGGRYHGSSVYEEQVRVPLVMSAPGAIPTKVVTVPVQTIDLLPTILGGLGIPARPRIRGRDLSALLTEASVVGPGFAYAETNEQAMLAEGHLRLICQRKLGACRLYDLEEDPKQQKDASSQLSDDAGRLRQSLQQLNASHGQYERAGLRAEGKGWPNAILRGISGDGDAALEIAELLDDADVEIRRKAAETLFKLRNPATAASLRLALDRDEDEQVRRFAALSLTRLGQGASLTMELLTDEEVRWRRWAALTLAESGDRRGEAELVAWWMTGDERSFEESVAIVQAFATIRSRMAVGPLLRTLDDVRLRPHIARALSKIGDEAARGRLALALTKEPYQTARVALAEALVELGGENELVMPLRRWLGVPDPLQGGLGLAARAGILEHIGGPSHRDMRLLHQNAELGELVRVIVPKGGNGAGVRLIARANNPGPEPAALRVGVPHEVFSYDAEGKLKKARKIPEIHPTKQVRLEFPAASVGVERFVDVPAELGLRAGQASHVVVLAGRGLELEAFAVLPNADELEPERAVVADEKQPKTPRHTGNDAGNQ